MENKLNYSQKALQDLNEIWDYILVEFSNPDAAENVVTGIMNVIDKLDDFPEMGTPLSSMVTMEKGV